MEIADVGQFNADPRGSRGRVNAGNGMLSGIHHGHLCKSSEQCACAHLFVKNVSTSMQSVCPALPHEVTQHVQVFSRR